MQLFLIIYFYKAVHISGCFLRPSSAAHNCIFSFRCCQPILLQAGIVSETIVISDICEVFFSVYCGYQCCIAQPLTATFCRSVLSLSLSFSVDCYSIFSMGFCLKMYIISTGFLLVLIYRMMNHN